MLTVRHLQKINGTCLCYSSGVNNTAKLNTISGTTRGNFFRKGAMLFDSIIALVVLGFLIRPELVQEYNEEGVLTTTIELTFPMTDFLAYIDNFGTLIDRTWAGMDADFNYTGPKMSELALPLMRATAQNGISMMTAGFVDRDGTLNTDLNDWTGTYEDATKAQAVAFYETARAGMAQ